MIHVIERTSSGPTLLVKSDAIIPAHYPPAPLAETERRHLTVISCKLADAKRLTAQLDPEDHYDLMQTFHTAALEVIARYEGYVAQHLDDGLLIYFGYPQALEDAALRAVRCGWDLVEALSRIVPPGLDEGQNGLVVRFGIASGMVIVPSSAASQAQSSLAVGAPAIQATRLGELARPGTVVMSEATAQLVEGHFDCKLFCDPALLDDLEPQLAYEVVSEHALQTRLDIEMAQGLTPFVGRVAELALLDECWTYVQEGMGQVVMLRGETGIGKSRLLQACKDRVADEQLQLVECRCSPYHQDTVLYPLIDLIQRAVPMHPDVSEEDNLRALEAFLRPYADALPLHESVPLLANLLSLPIPEGHYVPPDGPPQRQHERTLDVLSTLLLPQASEAPMLFIVEDLHWADPSTLTFLEGLMGQVPTTSMLIVLTYRPTFETPWKESVEMTTITLNRLTQRQSYEMTTQVAGGQVFSAAAIEQLLEKMDGVPLFVEELTRMALETGQFKETERSDKLADDLVQLTSDRVLRCCF
ncbi:hypothetical protein C2W62_42840 [Candidatus Entotheonella serta]|nr:hypothetical protein C2W62_42840 [Candidatus Entotheonella serta]